MAYRHQITQADFDRIQTLRRSGMSLAEVREMTGHGVNTIEIISRVDSLEGYQQARRAINDRYRGVVRDSSTETVFSRAPSRRTKIKHNFKIKDFEKAKMLRDIGLTYTQIAEVMGISTASVRNMTLCTNWKEYEEFKERNRKRLAIVKAKAIPVDVAEAFEETTSDDQPKIRVVSPTLGALERNTAALKDLAIAWNHLSDKLDEVLETKKPWLERIKH